MKLLNYTLKEILFDSYKTTIFRAIDDSSGKSVVLKKKDIFNSVNGYVSLKKEYELLQKIKSKSFLNVIDFIETDNENFLVFEDIGGISLKRLMLEQKISLSTFCKIAIDITIALTDIHNSGYIHRDISITNIIWSETLKKAKLIDLNLAVKNTSLLKLDSSKDYIVGTLSYISPEQTGRINYSIDFRSDLYSLGIVFYEILSGHLPFISNSEIELIHSHIALEAKPLHLERPDLPITLSKIVAKLMAKNPDDRYQTALGLLHDLQKFSEALLHENNDEFILGEKDFSGFLQFPQKLYDRDIEKTQIKLVYEKIDSQTKGITIVKGQPGVGKTYFIERFGNYVNKNHGRFLSGRFSINTKNIPYSGIREVLSDYIYRIFSEGPELIEIKRKKINEAIGKNGKVLTDILPELEELIGKQPGVEPLEGIMAENRFNYALKQLLIALIEPNNVSVVFLDDLQHIDSASLKILQFLLANADINGLMIILAYRENEISTESNLNSFLAALEKSELTQLIHLQPI
ncbi:MAG: AAA family ATPase, partial [Bacteroidales bacterium]|nr:AAA family ATPase [Bacteroidales bacterium]